MKAIQVSIIAALSNHLCYSYTIPTSSKGKEIASEAEPRRNFLKSLASIGIPMLTSFPNNKPAIASIDDKPTDVYFGVGCFWHIQHEFVEAERTILKRNDKELTSRTGYAGGKKSDSEGRVCYHNFSGIADYGKLGHGEVVGMTIPESAIGDFAAEYFNLFAPNGNRVDPGDRGPEYRSLLGLPGGANHAMYPAVENAAKSKGFELKVGKGDDPDTLGQKLVFVMDSEKFPFYQAEVYHQFHDDFQSPPYGKKYNNLVRNAFEEGRVKDTNCPDRFPS